MHCHTCVHGTAVSLGLNTLYYCSLYPINEYVKIDYCPLVHKKRNTNTKKDETMDLQLIEKEEDKGLVLLEEEQLIENILNKVQVLLNILNDNMLLILNYKIYIRINFFKNRVSVNIGCKEFNSDSNICNNQLDPVIEIPYYQNSFGIHFEHTNFNDMVKLHLRELVCKKMTDRYGDLILKYGTGHISNPNSTIQSYYSDYQIKHNKIDLRKYFKEGCNNG